MTDNDWTHTMTHPDGDQRIRVRMDEGGRVFIANQAYDPGDRYVTEVWARESRQQKGWSFEPRPQLTLQERFEALPVGTRVEVTYVNGTCAMFFRSTRGVSRVQGEPGRIFINERLASFVVLEPVGEVQS